MTVNYQASCHCGAVKLAFEGEEISSALRCNCSLCSRKGAMMTPYTVPPENFTLLAGEEDLGLYQFDTKVAKHFFCKHCGIYTHNMPFRAPTNYRVNLGCIEGLDTTDFEVTVFDGKHLL